MGLLRTALGAATAVLACTTPATPAAAADAPYDVLVFSKTAGFRHDAIPAGIQAVRDLGAANNFTVTATEDAAQFTTANLARYEAVVFLNTTGDVLNATQQTAFEAYVGAGGGYVGVHAAADTEYDWPFYGNLVGAWFASHPAIQPANVKVEDRAHAATAHLPQTWNRTDEWYNYRTNARSTAHVLATLDESSYSGGSMGGDHPHAWCKTYAGGRSFYTGGGHTQASYADAAFRAHLLGGIRYAAGRAKADCRPETGYAPLYTGATTGWSQAGPGSFTNADATLTSVGGMGLYWYSARQFTTYSLKLDWRLAGDDNSGVFIGFPPSSDPWSAVDNGYEIQIDPTDSPDRTTGAVYTFKSADLPARDAALNPAGEWNTYELLVEGERLQVFLNGVKINDFTNTDPARSLAGHVGIQNHGTGDDVSFRNIRIKELGTTPPTGNTTVQAEAFSSASGVTPFTKAGANGGQTLGYVDPGDWAAYQGLDLTGVTALRARVVSGGPGGTLQLRTGSPTGAVLGQVAVPNTGGWTTFADVSTALAGVPTGSQTVWLTFAGTGSGLYDVDDFTLVRGGGGGGGTGPVRGLAGKCLDVRNAATADGTQIQLYTCNG
ncbi:ThuA domain-containing protein, partial [Micromonospora sp. NPDC005305]|uniref:ThuA domain-containing protein n=1 Tax=Micromonospora sp. NPDC005305 TaxID=3156875 RepID=UPI0033B14873